MPKVWAREQTEEQTTQRASDQEKRKQDRGKGCGLKRWMQAVAVLYILLFFPVPGSQYEERTAPEAGEESMQAEAEEVSGSEEGESADDTGCGETEKGSGGNEPKPMIAITFDDGPDASSTPRLLDGLKERGVRATFFVIGENIEKEDNRGIIKRMQEEGHEIGNHTYHHVDLSKLNSEEAHRELMMTDGLIREITGEETSLVRPPFGAFPDGMAEELDKLYVKWTVDPLDWTTENVDEIVQKVVTDVQENDIILLHDCYESSVDAAFRIIDILKDEGYEFVTADRLLIE